MSATIQYQELKEQQKQKNNKKNQKKDQKKSSTNKKKEKIGLYFLYKTNLSHIRINNSNTSFIIFILITLVAEGICTDKVVRGIRENSVGRYMGSVRVTLAVI